MNVHKPRCTFKHDRFYGNNYKGDGTKQCWMTDYVVNYGTEDNPLYYCQFHKEKARDKEGYLSACPGQPDCSDFKSEIVLKKLLAAWNEENKSLPSYNHKTFALPGISCKGRGFEGFEFSESVIFDDSFFYDVEFKKTIFRKEASFKKVMFTCNNRNEAYFCEAQFEGDARFDDAVFKVDMLFESAKFSGEASFMGCQFQKKACFKKVQFNSRVRFEDEIDFLGETSFEKTVFSGYTEFTGITFQKKPNYESSHFKCDLNLRAIFKEGAHFDFAHFDKVVNIYANTRFEDAVGFKGGGF